MFMSECWRPNQRLPEQMRTDYPECRQTMKTNCLFTVLVFLFLAVVSCGREDLLVSDSSYVPPQETADPDEGTDEPAVEPDDFDKVLAVLQEYYLRGYRGESGESARNTLDSYVSGYMSTMTDIGMFPAIDYVTQTNFPAMSHLNYAGQMAIAYVLPESIHYESEELWQAINKALWYWYLEWPTSSNWWNNQIAVPRDLAKPLILMRAGKKPLSADIENALLSKWKSVGGDPGERTGANKSDIAMHWLYRGCLEKDAETVEYAVEQAFEPLQFAQVGKDGIQYDWSYFQHNAQLYIGGYADVMLDAVVEVANYVSGTDYIDVMSPEQKDILCGFVTGTMAECIWGQNMYFNVMGRSVSRKGALNAAESLISSIDQIQAFETSHSSEYNAARQMLEDGLRVNFSSVKPSLKHHYIGDYTTYRCPDWSACLRMVSNRTYRSEDLNGENEKGYWISDGSLSLNIQGDEYFDIFPVWEWTKVPGVTAPQTSSIPRNAGYTHVGQSGFTGGVTDGTMGISVYEMRNTRDGVNIYANKSWFFEGDAIVCIGTGIESTMSEEIVTSVNQCWKSGPVLSQSDISGRITRVWHDRTGYIIDPDSGNLSNSVVVTEEIRTGDWKDINDGQSGYVSGEVFELYISHGSNVSSQKKGSYSFYIVPGVTQAEFDAFDTSDIRIVAIQETLHAVRNESSGSLHIAFFKKGTLSLDDVSVTVDNPCLLVLDDDDTVFISSPYYQKPASTTITVTRGEITKSATAVFSSDGDNAGITHKVILS